MKHNADVPEVLQELNLTPDQLRGVKGYIALQAQFANRQLTLTLGLVFVVGSALTITALASDAGKEVPFESIVELALRYVTLMAAGVAVAGVGLYEFAAHKARKVVGGALSLSAKQEQRVQELGDEVSRYVLFGWILDLGRKKSKGGDVK